MLTGRRLRRVMLFMLAVAVLFSGCAASARVDGQGRRDAQGRTVRVLVIVDSDSAPMLTIEGAKGYGRAVVMTQGPGGVTLNRAQAALPFRFEPAAELVRVNRKSYRGVIEVRERNGALLVINELPLESYLVGIINSEISSKWPLEALKAQAVVSRTYALYQAERRRGEPYDLTATHMDQVYIGAGVEDAASFRAVRETRGQALFHNGAPALTVFHSNAGGVTEASTDVWSSGYPYLRSVRSVYDSTAPNYRWELEISAAALGDYLGRAGRRIGLPVKVSVVKRSSTGRVKLLAVRDADGGGIELSGEDMRKALGYASLKSTLFKVRERDGQFVFSGVGSGHGVGLSQWGAKGMAENGKSYRKILNHYYRGTELRKAY